MLVLVGKSVCLIFLIMSVFVLSVKTLYWWSSNMNKMLSFECGFNSLVGLRAPFSNRFFLLILIFLVFDVEVGVFLGYLMAMNLGEETMILSSVIFIFFLLLGLYHEWNESSLSWGVCVLNTY